MMRTAFATVLLSTLGLTHNVGDDVGQSMAAIDSIVQHAIISDPPASNGASDFVNAMAGVPAPSISYKTEAAPAAGCERNMELAYSAFLKTFPSDLYPSFAAQFENNLVSYKNSSAFNAYERNPNQHRCGNADLSKDAKDLLKTRHIVPYPAKVALPLVGMDLVEKTVNTLFQANGPASAQTSGIGAVSASATQQQKGVLEMVAAIAATDIPPMIPPPVWNNMPLPCMPMMTGHNCFGAVNYPITVGDFILADTSDSYLSGVISNFPSLYRQKVGKTDDKSYQTCYSAYMSMQCASTFPTCTTVQAREEQVPFVGRGPMCFLHCVATLIACPGFWIDDILDTCQNVSVPPVCALAHYTKAAPAQLQSFDEANAYPMQCPSFDPEIDQA